MYERTVLVAIAVLAIAGLLPHAAQPAKRLLCAFALGLALVCFTWLRP
jgi:hypothetical protein